MKSLRDHLREHLDRLRSLNFSPLTIRQARYCAIGFLDWLETNFDVKNPDCVRPQHLQAWQKQMVERITLRGGPIKARTVNKHVETLIRFLEYLAAEGVAYGQLAKVVQYVREPRVLPGSVLGHDQTRRLLDGVATDTPDGYVFRTMLEMLYTSGIRAAELLTLNVDDLDLNAGTARVMGKGRKERVVPIGKTAVRFLDTYVKAVRPQLLKKEGEEALFLDSAGRRVRYYTFRRRIKACAASARLRPDITPHTFRRSCTTELLRGGANMYHVKELLGHESLDTLKHYAKLTIIDLKKTHEKCHPREKDGQYRE